MSDVILTRAAVELRALVDRVSVSEVARRAETSRSMVHGMVAGRKTPGRELKARLVALGIAADGWTMPVVPDAPARPTLATEAMARRVTREKRTASLGGDIERDSAIARLVESISELEELIDEARYGGPMGEDGRRSLPAPATHIASLMRVKVTALDRLAHLRGEGEITTATIRRSKAWHEMLSIIEAVLAKHPEAARDFTEAFAKLG